MTSRGKNDPLTCLVMNFDALFFFSGAVYCLPFRHVCAGWCTGADPSRRDYGRCLCAEEWARFCGCHNSADAIAKYIRSTKYFLKKTFLHLSKVRDFNIRRGGYVSAWFVAWHSGRRLVFDRRTFPVLSPALHLQLTGDHLGLCG